jgi:serine/threonine-protein kinase 24/25/MST4
LKPDSINRQEIDNQEDLWDFGTVRHGGRPSTIGRAQNSVRAATGPPLTWENNGTAPRYDERSPSPLQRVSIPSQTSLVPEKGNRDLPPLPSSSASSSRFQQSTVRHMPQPVDNNHKINPTTPLQRVPSDEYEDYGDQYAETYSSTKSNIVQQKMQDMHLEDDLPDTTMLDSVVLPAIASVRIFPIR